jgi:hypothetical protein
MNLPGRASGFAALATLALALAAVLLRRFNAGFLLFHVAVALGERWRALRERGRVAASISSHMASLSLRPDSADRAA